MYMRNEVLTVNVRLTGDYEVKGHTGAAKMLLFGGDVDCDNFKGVILPGGVDTQSQKVGESVHLSARYIIEGEDYTGKKCRLFIENNGCVESDGSIVTNPKIYTDSEALAYLEKQELTGTVEGNEEGIKIHIFKEDI